MNKLTFHKKTLAEISLPQALLFFLLLILFTGACDKLDTFSRPYVATVNGVKLYHDEYRAKLEQKKALLPQEALSYKTNDLRRLEEEVLENMITEKLMLLRAAELNIHVSDDELKNKINEIKDQYGDGFNKMLQQEHVRYEDWLDELKKELLLQKLIAVDVNAHVRVSEDEAEDYFAENRQQYRNEARVRLSQVFVRDFERAKDAEKSLLAGADFAMIASEYSIGPEAVRGGDMGFITRGIMPEPLDEAIFKLPVNKISPIIKSSYGFHIFIVKASEPARMSNYEDVKEEVMSNLRAKKEEDAFRTWLESMKIKAVVKKNTALRKN